MSRLDVAIQSLRTEFLGDAKNPSAEKTADLAFGQRLLSSVTAARDGSLPEHLHLAARFHFPISPGYWRKAQWKILAECGYSLAESHRIVNLMERGRCLDGDPEMLFLMEHTGHILLFEDIFPKSDSLWSYRIQEVWKHLPVQMRKAGRSAHKELRKLPTIERGPHRQIYSKHLGESVYAGDLYRTGFSNVVLPMLRYGMQMVVDDDERITDDKVDEVIGVWLALGDDARQQVAPRILAYKRLVEDATGEKSPIIETPEQVWDHIDLNWASIEVDDEGLCLTISGDCVWEPEHGLQVKIDDAGAVLDVGEVD